MTLIHRDLWQTGFGSGHSFSKKPWTQTWKRGSLSGPKHAEGWNHGPLAKHHSYIWLSFSCVGLRWEYRLNIHEDWSLVFSVDMMFHSVSSVGIWVSGQMCEQIWCQYGTNVWAKPHRIGWRSKLLTTKVGLLWLLKKLLEIELLTSNLWAPADRLDRNISWACWRIHWPGMVRHPGMPKGHQGPAAGEC